MRERLTHNFGLKILSLALAVLVWLVVLSIEDPVFKYGSIYKHKYEMVGWCSKNSSGIVDDGKITGFHAI